MSELHKDKYPYPLALKLLALVLVPLVVITTLLMILAIQLMQAEAQEYRQAHARKMRELCTIVSDHTANEVRGVVKYLVTKDRAYLIPVQDAEEHRKDDLAKLKELAKDNINQIESVQNIAFLWDRIGMVASMLAHEQPLTEEMVKNVWQAGDLIEVEIRKLQVFETRASGNQQPPGFFREQVKQTLIYGAAISLFSMFLCFYMVGLLIYRLKIVQENFKRFAMQQLLLPPVGGEDEIAEIDDRFRYMVAEKEEYIRKEQVFFVHAKDLICSLDAERRILRINDASRQILGYESSEVTGHLLDEYLAPSTARKVIESLEKAVKDESSVQFEISVINKDGSTRVLHCSPVWLRQEQALLCNFHDITELKRLERTKQDFVAMVSHDLRSPLMSVQATLEMLEDSIYGNLNSAGSLAVASSQRNLLFLLQFVEQILDVEKIESGRFDLARKLVPLQPVIDRGGELVDDLADKKKVKLELCRTQALAYIDEDRMVQVIVNLLSNAIKYAPPDTAVRLSVMENLKENMVEVTVSDQGRGIPAGMEQIIFDRFQQVNLADWKEKKGSGLGLAICKLIVEAHGGKIGVESVEGKGSTFWFNVPARPEGDW